MHPAIRKSVQTVSCRQGSLLWQKKLSGQKSLVWRPPYWPATWPLTGWGMRGNVFTSESISWYASCLLLYLWRGRLLFCTNRSSDSSNLVASSVVRFVGPFKSRMWAIWIISHNFDCLLFQTLWRILHQNMPIYSTLRIFHTNSICGLSGFFW